ncbi:MAG: hypothetical protein ABEJ83_03175, partial [Candidatus Nanohaloarchaea archaeon]
LFFSNKQLHHLNTADNTFFHMTQRKGMSQVLALIVAAAIFMVVALSLIMITQGGLTSLLGGTQTQKCKSTLQTQCAINQGGKVSVPASCEKAGIQQVLINGKQVGVSGKDRIKCPTETTTGTK